MNSKANILQIKRYSHNSSIVISVFYWASIVAACGALIAGILIKLISGSHFVLGQSSIGHLGFSLDGLIKYNLNEASLQGTNMENIYVAIMIMAASILFLMMLILKQLVLILKSVEGDKPFAKENANRITTVGVVLILSSFLIPAFEVYVAKTIIDTFNIQNITTNYSANIYLILTGFMLFILSGIFNYGSYLQYEYDETV